MSEQRGKFLGIDFGQVAVGLKQAYDRHVELDQLRAAADMIIASARKNKDGSFDVTPLAMQKLKDARGNL